MEKWMVYNKKADFQKIGSEFGIDPVIARLIRNRDIQDMKEIRYLFIWNTCGNSIPMEDEGYGTCSADPSEKNYAEKKDPNHRRL